MKSRFFNALLIPALLSFLVGVMTMYGYVKFDSLIPIEQNKVEKLQSALKLIDCKAINKDAILSIAQGNVESAKDMANVLFSSGILWFVFVFTNFSVVYKYLKRPDELSEEEL